MGSGVVTAAVVDAGPLIHLHEIDRLPLLQLFTSLYLPDAVWSETVGQGRLADVDILRLKNVERTSVSSSDIDRFIQQNDLADLHAGECQCLYLCQQLPVSLILTDDLAVRDVSKRLALTPIGSLGIVVRAYRQSLITLADAELAISQLYDVSSLFVTRAIVDLAIEQLRQRTSQDTG
jgi:predicted nucleic acid-binding protein